MPLPGNILIYCRDPQLLQTRGQVLQRAGYQVWTASNLSELVELTSQPKMDVMLLCHTLSKDECGRALAVTHARWPKMQTIALVAGVSGCPPAVADAVLYATDGPVKLIQAVREHVV